MRKYKTEAENLYASILFAYKRILMYEDDGILENMVKDILSSEEKKKNQRSKDITMFGYIKAKTPFCYPFIASERPDIIYKTDDFIIGIEHFQFDSSNNKSGSKLEEETRAIHRELDSIARNSNEKDIQIEKNVNVSLSFENYKQALLRSFDKHYKKIDDYRKNLREYGSGKEVKMAFYIEDVTPFENMIITDKGRENLNPLCVKEFTDILDKADKLDYIIVKYQNSYLNYLYFFQLTDYNMESLQKENYDMEHFLYMESKHLIECTYYGCDEE